MENYTCSQYDERLVILNTVIYKFVDEQRS